ncbi:hypothetical protein I4U23_016894 [Adineta vaga]|nr:hypothetical protein I4U23_016894 [Adineta vaga]
MFHKQALLIGNDGYLAAGNRLKSCVYDVKTMTISLRSIGFNATPATDLHGTAMQSLTGGFAESIRPGAIVVFYFSGHGLQFNGNNLLIPIDYPSSEPLDAQILLKKMHRNKPRVVIFILDCCRSRDVFPYTEVRGMLFDGRPKLRDGLAAMGGPPSTIIAFSCAADSTSLASSLTRPNSIYTHHLLNYITRPNVDIDILLKYTAVDVQQDSENKQLPFIYSNCNESICLNSNPWPMMSVWPDVIQFNPLLSE